LAGEASDDILSW